MLQTPSKKLLFGSLLVEVNLSGAAAAAATFHDAHPETYAAVRMTS
jgi:hypothetical protein